MIGRTRLGCVALGLLLAIVFAPASPALAKGVSVTTVGGEQVVGAHAVSNFSARCPAKSHPVAGELSSLDAAGDGQVVLAASFRTGRRGWRISISAYHGPPWPA
jgi:hypothetical protein